MQTYAAIDLHSNNGVVAVIDDNDKVLRQKKIQCLERAVLKKARLRSEFEPLRTVWGIGPILGLTIMYEAGSMDRFQTPGNFAS